MVAGFMWVAVQLGGKYRGGHRANCAQSRLRRGGNWSSVLGLSAWPIKRTRQSSFRIQGCRSRGGLANQGANIRSGLTRPRRSPPAQAGCCRSAACPSALHLPLPWLQQAAQQAVRLACRRLPPFQGSRWGRSGSSGQANTGSSCGLQAKGRCGYGECGNRDWPTFQNKVLS